MIQSYLPILILTIIAVVMPFVTVTLSGIFGPKVRNLAKEEPYECGVPSDGSPSQPMPVKFYKIAIFFLLMDVEAALLFPWAVIFKEKVDTWGSFYLISEFLIFACVLVAGFAYAWKRGALDWE